MPKSHHRDEHRAVLMAQCSSAHRSTVRGGRVRWRTPRRLTASLVVMLMPAALVVACSADHRRDAGIEAHSRLDLPRSWSPPAVASESVGCLTRPSVCGFPDRSNTGPAGPLTASGSITVTKAGTVIEGLDVRGCVVIDADDVVLRDSRVSGCPSAGVQVKWSGVSNVVIERVEIDGGGIPGSIGIWGSGMIVAGANIHGTGDAIDVGDDVLVRDTYIHDLIACRGCHVDGIQSSGSTNVRVTHSTILASGVNSAIIFGADQGAIGTVGADHNLIDGGSYTVYAGTGGTFDSGHISFVGNRFGRSFQYGPNSFVPSPGRTVEFRGNVWDDTGDPVL